jgi:type IX secretion system PorP/SprF family membrane protein
MAKKYILILLFTLFRGLGFGQNLPHFTQYVFNSVYLNPGAAGQANRLQIQSTVRSQYLGYTGTQYSGGSNLSTALSVDMPVAKLKGGIGLQFANQNISKAQGFSEALVSYSFHKQLGSNIIGIGAGVGIGSLNLHGDEYIPRDPDDPYIPSESMNSIAPRVNAGIYLVNPSYQIGLSARNLLEPEYKMGGTEGAFKDKRDYVLTARYDFPLSYTLDLSPMLMVRSDLVSTQVEVGALITYNQRLWLGGNYRLQDAGSFLIGTNLLENKLKLGYALDIITEGQGAKSTTSHELFLRYVLGSLRMGKKSIVKTPRYSIP